MKDAALGTMSVKWLAEQCGWFVDGKRCYLGLEFLKQN